MSEGLGVRAKRACLFPTQRTQMLYPYQLCPPLLRGGRADKGTSVRHRIAAAGAISPSGCVSRQARLFALTPFVPLSREAGEGDCGVRKRSFRLMLKLPLQHSKHVRARLTPLPRCGSGAGGEGGKSTSVLTQRTHVLYPYQLHPSPPSWERGWG